MSNPKVAFICVHNSCRSQIAEALGRHFAADTFTSYSAGTQTVPVINQDAVRLMKTLYGLDLEALQYPKLLSAIPEVDIVITMGCNVHCPILSGKHGENWGLNDPSGQPDQQFKETILEIEEKVLDLRRRIKNGL